MIIIVQSCMKTNSIVSHKVEAPLIKGRGKEVRAAPRAYPEFDTTTLIGAGLVALDATRRYGYMFM